MPSAAIFGGIGQGLGQGIRDAAGLEQLYQAGQDQAAQQALGRTLQMLGAGSPMGGGPMGGGPMGGPQQQPQMPMQSPPQQMAQAPPMPQGSPPMAPPQGGGQVGAPTPQPMARGPIGQPGQGPQPMGGGMGGGGGQGPLDWRQILQAVTQANPGAPPQVIAGAVNRAIPLMNSQSQQEWRMVQMQMREQALDIAQQRLMMQQQQGQERIQQGQERLQQGEERIGTQRELYGLSPAQGQQFSQDFDKPGGMGGRQDPQKGTADLIADDIASGKRPPITTGMYRMSGAVISSLAKNHPEFDVSRAQLEWKKAERMVQGLTSPQQVRFQQLGTAVVNTMNQAVEQAKQLQLSGITPLNRAKLEALVNYRGNSPIGQQAAKYLQTVAFLKGEVANLENGGYAPTESSWAQARNVINENYGVEEFLATIPNAQNLIKYRLSAQQQLPGGMTEGDRYSVPQGGKTQEQAPQGIPQGWTVKEH